MREVADLVGYCALYEFEDVVVDTTGAELAKVVEFDALDMSRKIYKLARYVTGSSRVADSVTPAGGPLELQKDYELFLAVFNHPHELFALNAVDGWRRRSRFAAAYLCEAWATLLPVYLLELLKPFDHIFVGVKSSVDAVARVTGRPCSYLPMGVDALEFCPFPAEPHRTVDICGIGRRSRVTHESLLRFSNDRGWFYYYDTTRAGIQGSTQTVTFRVTSPRDHRRLLASLLKRSRYFIANRAWADRPNLTGGNDEIAARFYEGAAAGAIMVGEAPDSDDFRAQFGWPDSVIRMAFDSPHAGEVIAKIDADADRAARIRRNGVVHSLRTHDWVYRLRKVFDAAGLPATPGMVRRENELRRLADSIDFTRTVSHIAV